MQCPYHCNVIFRWFQVETIYGVCQGIGHQGLNFMEGVFFVTTSIIKCICDPRFLIFPEINCI